MRRRSAAVASAKRGSFCLVATSAWQLLPMLLALSDCVHSECIVLVVSFIYRNTGQIKQATDR
jgi:hypothetical protein